MEQQRILVLLPLEERHKAVLETAAPGIQLTYAAADTVTREQVQQAQVIIGNPPVEYVAGSSNLRWFQSNTAGPDPYLKEGVISPQAVITNATGAYGLAISEHMLGMLLMIFKKLELYRDAQLKENWSGQGQVRTLLGATVLVMGMGDIGGSFARLCKAMGAYVIGLRRSDGSRPDYANEVHLTGELDSLLPRADVVAVTLPGTPETRGMLGKERIGKMKPGAVVLNVGRGYLLDTEALCDALESGRLGGAGLDVTEPEPLPKGHRLWGLPTAVITPHVSGGYHLWETHERIVDIFVENLGRFLRGEALKNLVDFETGYRKL